MATKDLTFNLFGRDRGASSAVRGVGSAALVTQKNVAQAARGIGIGLGIATAAAVAFGASSVAAFKEAQTAQKELTFAYDKFEKLSDLRIDALRDYNSELALTTKYDDDATASGQAVLAQFGLTGHQIMKLTPLLQDYASATGKALPDAAQDLGKALLGQGRALKAVGIEFSDTGDLTANFDQLVGQLSTTVGGFAEKEGKTAAGQAEILSNRFGEFQETIGGKLLPGIIILAETFGTTLMPKLEAFADWFSSDEIQAGLAGFAGFVSDGIENLPLFGSAILGVTGFAWGLSLALDANPIGLFIAAIGLGIIYWGLLVNSISGSLAIIGESWNYFEAAGINAVGGVIDALNFLMGPLNGVLNLINAITGSNLRGVYIPQFSADAVSSFTTVTARSKGARPFAEGGIVPSQTGGVFANIGEGRHDEVVLPLTDRNLSMLGGGKGGDKYSFTINGFIGGDTAAAQKIIQMLRDAQRNGAIPVNALAR